MQTVEHYILEAKKDYPSYFIAMQEKGSKTIQFLGIASRIELNWFANTTLDKQVINNYVYPQQGIVILYVGGDK